LHKNAFRSDPLESYSAPPDSLAVIREEGGGEGKERIGKTEEGLDLCRSRRVARYAAD